MMDAVGVAAINELFVDVPADVLDPTLDLPDHKGELEVERILGAMAAKNRTAGEGAFFVGAGAYKHHVPATVDHIIQRSEFLTSYTPYQPEIAQGTLQYLFEFQTQVAALTGMDVANASMYDGSTATAEAALMARRITKRNKVIMAGGLHPHYAEVVRPDWIKVRYLDRDNEIRELQADGLLSTCIQHEMDHLEGKLFVDYLSNTKRQLIRKKLQKLQKQA